MEQDGVNLFIQSLASISWILYLSLSLTKKLYIHLFGRKEKRMNTERRSNDRNG